MSDQYDDMARQLFGFCEVWDDLVEDELLWTAEQAEVAKALRDLAAEKDAEIERLRAALADISDMSGGPNYEISHHTVKRMALKALGE